MPLPRNPVARAPILRKGGPHTRARSGERARARLDLDDALAEWAGEQDAHDLDTETFDGMTRSGEGGGAGSAP